MYSVPTFKILGADKGALLEREYQSEGLYTIDVEWNLDKFNLADHKQWAKLQHLVQVAARGKFGSAIAATYKGATSGVVGGSLTANIQWNAEGTSDKRGIPTHPLAVQLDARCIGKVNLHAYDHRHRGVALILRELQYL